MHKVAIIGGGPGGYTAAIRAAQLGLQPLLFEKSVALGGTCLHRGCIPTKVFVETANRYQELGSASDFGLQLDQVSLDWHKVQERKSSLIKRLSTGIDGLMKANKVTVVRGEASLLGEHSLSCGEAIYEVENIILASGSEVAAPKLFPIDGERVVTSDEMLRCEQIPASLIVVGAGAVGMEFAALFARLGCQVTVIEALERVLPLEDEEVSAEVKRLARKINLKIYTGCSITAVSVVNGMVAVRGEGLPEVLQAEKLLVAVGRKPSTAALQLDKAGVKTERGRVLVDEFMRSSVPNIYAIGDIAPTPQLAHVATAEGLLAVEHIAGLHPQPLNYRAYPGATYCWPEVASVGLTEAQARAEYRDVLVGKFPLAALGKANISGATDGFIKVVADSVEKRVLGVHMVGLHVADMIAEAVVAVQNGLTLEQVAASIHPHPSLSEGLMEAVQGALGQPLNYVPLRPRAARVK